MSALEQEIFDRVRHLDEDRQQRVLAFIDSMDDQSIASDDALTRLSLLGDQLQAKYGSAHFLSVQSILDEVREERLNDILGGR